MLILTFRGTAAAHRMQHEIPFLWDLHSYHHRVTDLKASNGEVSNPVVPRHRLLTGHPWTMIFEFCR